MAALDPPTPAPTTNRSIPLDGSHIIDFALMVMID